jgi:hypothetical protein
MNSELSYQAESAGAIPEPDPQNFFSRLTGVLFSPGETFEEIGRAPRVLIPLIMVMALGAYSSFFVTNRIGYENIVRKQMESVVNAGWMSQEQADQQIQRSLTGRAATIGKIQGPVGAAIGFLVVMLIVAGVFKLFTMLMGGNNTFKPLLAVITYAYLAVGIVSAAIMTITLFLKDPEEIDLYNPVSSNLGAILTMLGAGLPKFLNALTSWVDVFGIWRIILLAIGCAAVTPRMKSGTAAIPHVILYVIIALVFSSFATMFG